MALLSAAARAALAAISLAAFAALGCSSAPLSPQPPTPTTAAPIAQPQGADFSQVRWRAYDSLAHGFSMPLPEDLGWRIEDRSDSWFVAAHAQTRTQIVARVFTVDALANRTRCEAHARELGAAWVPSGPPSPRKSGAPGAPSGPRAPAPGVPSAPAGAPSGPSAASAAASTSGALVELPEREGAVVMDRHRVDLPTGFDTIVEVGLLPTAPGAPIQGYVMAFGGWAKKCFAYALTTSAKGTGAEEAVGDRLALFVERSFLKIHFGSDLTPSVPREKPPILP